MVEKTCYDCAAYFKCDDHWKVYRDTGCPELVYDDKLEGRTARCAWCGKRTPSKPSLPFFEYREDKELDEYYCGCGGWD